MSIPNTQSDAPLGEAESASGSPVRRARARRRSKQRRRMANVAGLLLALVLTGAMYSVFAPAQAAEDGNESAAEAAGRSLYEHSCITCHGSNLQGVEGRGPSLIGVGEAAVYFQVHTGRMPLTRQSSQGQDKPAVFSEEEIDQLMAYVQANGGGPTLPSGDLRDGDLAAGGELFRLNCASCHNFVGEGGALSSGKWAPSLQKANDRTIYAAMLSGPENMPVFGDNQLSPQEKQDIIAYVQNQKSDQDPGGWGIGRLGPVPEALVIFLVGLVALIFASLWIAGKS